MLTVDEANAKEPCDREQLTQITKFSLGGVFDRLKGRTLTVLVTNISLIQQDAHAANITGNDVTLPPLTPDDCEAMAADLRGILGSVASDHRLPTAWTNKVPHPYNQYEQGKGDLGKDEFRATVHDPSRPPLTTYAELLRVMAENNVGSVSLDQAAGASVLRHEADYNEKTLFAPQGTTRVDITIPTEFKLTAQTGQHNANYFRRNPYPTFYYVDIASVKGARPGSALFDQQRANFKIDTNIEHERTHLEDAILFVNFGPATDRRRFDVCMSVKIPGMD